VHIQAAVFCAGQDARGDEQAEGDGDYEVVTEGRRVGCECVEDVRGEGEGGCCCCDGYYNVTSVLEHIDAQTTGVFAVDVESVY
jgi:hypothetical protein